MQMSAIRSIVESRKAPHALERPARRAMVPSRVSEKTKTVMTSGADEELAARVEGERAGATPSVPITVMTSGETPSFSSKPCDRREEPGHERLGVAREHGDSGSLARETCVGRRAPA